MTKREAAEILATRINVVARQQGITKITKDFIEEIRSESRHYGQPGNLIRQASETCPDWTTIRAAGRRSAGAR